MFCHRPDQTELKAKCLNCTGNLFIKKTCTQVYLYCKSCGSKYPTNKYSDLMDEFLEDQLANIRCDRL